LYFLAVTFAATVTRALILGAIFLAAATTHADQGEARAHYDRATSAFALGRFAEAAAEYEKALELAPDAALLFDAAQAHRLAGNQKRALLLYQNYLRIFGDQATNGREVTRFIENLKRSIESGEAAPSPRPEPIATEAATESTPSPVPVVVDQPPRANPLVAQQAPQDVSKGAPKPLWRRPWVWGVVGGAAAVLVVGLAVGLTVGTATHPPRPTLGSVEAN
jgi:tetratricopeptide (TPR) repeat protein